MPQFISRALHSAYVRRASSGHDYSDRSYLSAIESAKYLGISVEKLHEMAGKGQIKARHSASGQMRFALRDLQSLESTVSRNTPPQPVVGKDSRIDALGTVQRVIIRNSQVMKELEDGSVNLMITSPPYFDAKMYSRGHVRGDLGDMHNIDDWFSAISRVWKEVFRVLQPGRKAFVNIMNLPIRLADGGFRSFNLTGRTIDAFERIGFVFKRDIVWHKTNSVRAHFGTYPYPGGILINNSHEFILEFEKPAPRNYRKYSHLSRSQKEKSKLDREFWLSIKNSDVWLMHPEGSGDRRNHVAPFPLELPTRLIRAFSYHGETILDPFLGSGKTLVAAAKMGRNGVGYELMPEIAANAVESIRAAGTT